jgi:hypothetical protein
MQIAFHGKQKQSQISALTEDPHQNRQAYTSVERD